MLIIFNGVINGCFVCFFEVIFYVLDLFGDWYSKMVYLWNFMIGWYWEGVIRYCDKGDWLM